MPIPYSLAALGGETFIKTLWGMETIKVPKGTQCNDVLTIKGKGLPSQKNGKGDLAINVLIHVPKNLDDDAIMAIQNLTNHDS
jgi:DnaJ-class molecular chaperone